MTTRHATDSMWCATRLRRMDWGLVWFVACVGLAAWFGFDRNGSSTALRTAQAATSVAPRLLADSPSLPDGTRLQAIPISEYQVGFQVPAENPTGEKDLEFGETVDPPTWRKLVLLASKTDGSKADVTLLRPLWWFNEHDAKVGGTVEINVPECSISGPAEVLAIEPCPAIQPQHGLRIVTGTFRHHAGKVIELHVEGLDEPIGTTANHLFWSEDRQKFVRADELKEGEYLRAFNGTPIVRRIVPLADSEPVFNLEVQCDHVYHVAKSGLLVHNSEPCPIMMSIGSLLERQGPREMSRGTINSMANAMRENAEAFWQQAGPIRVAVHDGKRIIIDGHHRVAAARQAGVTDVPVIVEQVSDSRWGQLFIEVMEVLSGH